MDNIYKTLCEYLDKVHANKLQEEKISSTYVNYYDPVKINQQVD